MIEPEEINDDISPLVAKILHDELTPPIPCRGSATQQLEKINTDSVHQPISLYIDYTSPLALDEMTNPRWTVNPNCYRPPDNQCPKSNWKWKNHQTRPVEQSGRITKEHGLLYGRRLAVYENIKYCASSIVLLPLSANTCTLLPVIWHKPIQFLEWPVTDTVFNKLAREKTYCMI